MSSATVAVGAAAPHWQLLSDHHEQVSAESLRGTAVALMFFPYAFSRVCGSELAQWHARRAELAATGGVLVGISCDAVHTLRAYGHELRSAHRAAEGASEGAAQDSAFRDLTTHDDDAVGLGFRLLSDFWPHGEVAKSFGVFDEQRGVPRRVTVVVDPSQRVHDVIESDFGEPRSVDQVCAALTAAQAVRGAG